MLLEDLFSPTLYDPLFFNLLVFLPSLPTFLFPNCRPSPPGIVSFTDVTSTAGVGHTGANHGTAWADYDDDGDLDLYATNNGQANVLYQNDGDGTFTDVTSTASVGNSGNAQGMSWADYDGDGDLDLYITNYAANNVLYQNDGDIASITLVVKPLTDAGAPSVFGAVTLSTADGNVVALRTLDGGSGNAQNRSVLSGKGGKDRGACAT